MTQAKIISHRAAPVPLPENLTSVQPGGGVCYSLEFAWGRWRRWYLKRLRPGYVRRMAGLRRGSCEGAPHEVLDPRDLKYCANQCDCRWNVADDPFHWRERIPFARWGLAELQVMGYPLAAATVAALYVFPWAALVPAALLALVVYFFRDPPRRVPDEPGLIVAPADGKVVEVTRIEHDDDIGGPAVRIGVFLSIFNVHLNRAPCDARVIELRYSPGEFLSATRPESSLRNENLWIRLEQDEPPHRRLAVRQIAGAVARRIVCRLRPGETVQRGEKFGMIKLGSRTELTLPATEDLTVEVAAGRRIKGGVTVLARYSNERHD